MMRESVVEFLKQQNAFWQWAGHKYVAELTSGKLSDFFANCTPIFTHPAFQDRVGRGLAELMLTTEPANRFMKRNNIWVVGSAMGAIGLAQSLAKALQVMSAYTERIELPSAGMSLKRFNLGDAPSVILVEDVITTGGTTQKTVEAIRVNHEDVVFFPYVLCVINRSGTKDGFKVDGVASFKYAGLIEVEPKVWDSVADLPPEMSRCVPLRPKGNWDRLTTDFSL